MKCYFATLEFDTQLIKLLNLAHFQAADLLEIYQTLPQIEENDFQSWFMAWSNLAEDTEQLAEQDTCKHFKRGAFFRTSSYYRTAMHFLMNQPEDGRIKALWQKQRYAFEKGMALSETKPLTLAIPYKDTFFKAQLFLAQGVDAAPVLIVNQGYEGQTQESYHTFLQTTLNEGMHLLTFDGPGQGQTLFEQDIKMPVAWESVISSVIDALVKLPQVLPEELYLLGLGWGGLLATRAAAFDERIALLMTFPGFFDPLRCLEGFIPDIREKIASGDTTTINTLFGQAMTNKMIHLKFYSRMFIHGQSTPFHLIKTWNDYLSEEMIKSISCPTLIIDQGDDPFFEGQGKMLFDKLRCPRELLDHKKESIFAPFPTPLRQKEIFSWLSKTSLLSMKQ